MCASAQWILLRAIGPAPAHTYASLAAPPEGAAHAAPRAHTARRLHALVRQRHRKLQHLNSL